jgi:hypothetical protein
MLQVVGEQGNARASFACMSRIYTESTEDRRRNFYGFFLTFLFLLQLFTVIIILGIVSAKASGFSNCQIYWLVHFLPAFGIQFLVFFLYQTHATQL